MTELATLDLVAALPRLRRYARVLVGEAHRADELLIETVELAKSGIPRRTRSLPLRTRLFALMRELHFGSAQAPRCRSDTARKFAAMGSLPASAEILTRFAQLPVEEREVLLFAAVEGMPYDEIARIVDLTVATVVLRLNRARERMRGADAGCASAAGDPRLVD